MFRRLFVCIIADNILTACALECADVRDAVCKGDWADSGFDRDWHWIDQEGVRATQGPALIYADAEGSFWQVVAATAVLDTWLIPSELTVWGYDAPGCQGERLVADLPGRKFPFRWPSSTTPDELYVASEGGQPYHGHIQSYRVVGGTTCQETGLPEDPHWWWPHTDYTGERPPTDWVAPLVPSSDW